jgi:hypothetical protein
MRAVSTFSALKPGLTLSRLRKLLMSSPALTRSTSESATSETTRMLRRRRPREPPDVPLPLDLSVPLRSMRELCSAGTSPKMMPVTIEIIRVKPSTRPSIDNSFRRGSSDSALSGTDEMSRFSPHDDSSRPMMPPSAESRMLSVSNCWMRRRRPAPSASLTAISLCREAERASSRLATLAHAIRSTRLTAPSRMSSAGRIVPTTTS